MNNGRALQIATLGFLAVLLALAAGCSGDGLLRAAVSGEVLIDKEPLQEGSIEFFPIDGNHGPSVGGTITAGRYSLKADKGVIVGMNRVVIRGFRKSGRKIPDVAGEKDKLIDEMVPAVPPEFNNQSTLTREIVEGDNTLHFDLPGLKK